MMGMQAAGQRQRDELLADQVLVALVVGLHGHGGVAQHGFRAGGGDDQVSRRLRPADSGCHMKPFSSSLATSRSEMAVCSTGSQFTRRLPR
jgi:hypothetical protein